MRPQHSRGQLDWRKGKTLPAMVACHMVQNKVQTMSNH